MSQKTWDPTETKLRSASQTRSFVALTEKETSSKVTSCLVPPHQQHTHWDAHYLNPHSMYTTPASAASHTLSSRCSWQPLLQNTGLKWVLLMFCTKMNGNSGLLLKSVT